MTAWEQNPPANPLSQNPRPLLYQGGRGGVSEVVTENHNMIFRNPFSFEHQSQILELLGSNSLAERGWGFLWMDS